MGHVTLTTPILWTIYHQWTRTCYDQPIYQIWSLYLHPLRRYESQCNVWRMLRVIL